MRRRKLHGKNLNDFTDYRLTGDVRISQQATTKQVKCYEHLLLPLGPQSTILDVSCRDGRLTIPLAGFYGKTIGIDDNRRLLEEARNSGAELGKVQFQEHDVRQLPYDDNTFDGVISGFSSWGMYGRQEDQRVLNEMVRVLRPDGVFVLDYGNIDARLREIATNGVFNEHMQQQVTYELFETDKGEAVVRSSWVDPNLCYHWICQRVGFDAPLVVGAQQGYHPDNLITMLHKAALRETALYGDYDLSPINVQNNRIIIRGVKQGAVK